MKFVILLSSLYLTLNCYGAEIPDAVKNTQPETHPLLSPEETLEKLSLPPGFRATVFAAEPEIRQPIGMTFDARGRLWVAENDTYSERPTNYDLNQHDRILVFEDTDHDGRSDSRKVFWDEGQHLTSVEVGFGGVWALCAPDLLFVPDQDGDDIPDGDPQVMLTGFDNDTIRHNIVNGLKWGPDGWLYGRHGITTTSFVGTPETPKELRTPLNCGIWRFHPVTRKFEVVSRGTTNSWGHDWDKHGELFFINTVIGHLWHAIPGSHLERMFGEDFNPHLYRLMPQVADHYHWNTEEKWSDIRNTGVTSTTDTAGGGHAHCGMMIYQGTNWPQEYRGDVFALNLHGRRINRDLLDREGAGFVARHQADFAKTDDLWFRGIDLAHGPDGGVYVLDWSDIGECHENDGVHRTSGRIYKIVYGNVDASQVQNYAQLSNDELVGKLSEEDAWHHRMARKVLQERFVEGQDLIAVRYALGEILNSQRPVTTRLHALWALHSTGGASDEMLVELLKSDEEPLRCWAVQLLSQQADPITTAEKFQKLATSESSGLVLQHIVSSLQRFPIEHRLPVAAAVLKHANYTDDKFLPLMVWYAIEPAVAQHPDQAVELLKNCEFPEIQKFIARRIASDFRKQKLAVASLIDIATTGEVETAQQILQGIQLALDGWRKADKPENWDKASQSMLAKKHEPLTELVQLLSVTFGDGRALDELRMVAADTGQPFSVRSNAIRALVTARDELTRELLQKLLNDRDLAIDAIRGLAVIGDEKTPQLIVGRYNGFRGHIQPVAMETLCSRPEYATVLLKAVEEKKIDADVIPPFYVRQLRSFEDESLQRQLQKLYPEWRHTSEEKERRANELRQLLTESSLSSADMKQGQALFEKTCSACHKLYGKGGTLGPDLTGSQRSNLNYLLGNIVDPSAEVSEKFQMSILALGDGRAISGVIQSENDETLVIKTPNEVITVLKVDIEARKNSKLSMMPERQLDKMSEQEILDLFSYLMSKH